jgi:hypothetical protein
MKSIQLPALLTLILVLIQYVYAEAGPEAFKLSNLPQEEQIQLTQKPTESIEITKKNDSLLLADEMIFEYRSTQDRYRFYEAIMLCLGAVLSLIVVLSYIKKSPNCNSSDMVKATGLTLVIFATIIVILLADVDAQLTAAMGVLGGIAGYLFGTFNAPSGKSENDQNKAPAAGIPASE